MPADSFKDLYDFPGNLAAALKSILVADVAELIGADTTPDPDVFIFGPRENVGAPSNRIEVRATTFTQASDQQIQATADGEWYFAHYAGQISFGVSTPRETQAAAEHGNRVGRILHLMTPKAARFTSTNLPHYEILVLRLSSLPKTEPNMDENTDETEISYNVELWIRPGAFPAAASG